MLETNPQRGGLAPRLEFGLVYIKDIGFLDRRTDQVLGPLDAFRLPIPGLTRWIESHPDGRPVSERLSVAIEKLELEMAGKPIGPVWLRRNRLADSSVDRFSVSADHLRAPSLCRVDGMGSQRVDGLRTSTLSNAE